ncbi:Os03g0717950, partial [Oryza sativa Japonica Group]
MHLLKFPFHRFCPLINSSRRTDRVGKSWNQRNTSFNKLLDNKCIEYLLQSPLALLFLDLSNPPVQHDVAVRRRGLVAAVVLGGVAVGLELLELLLGGGGKQVRVRGQDLREELPHRRLHLERRDRRRRRRRQRLRPRRRPRRRPHDDASPSAGELLPSKTLKKTAATPRLRAKGSEVAPGVPGRREGAAAAGGDKSAAAAAAAASIGEQPTRRDAGSNSRVFRGNWGSFCCRGGGW